MTRIPGLLIGVLLAFAIPACREAAPPRVSTADGVSPVAGPSRLAQVGLSADDKFLGRLGGEGDAAPTPRIEPMPQRPPAGVGRFFDRLRRAVSSPQLRPDSREPFTLAGTDLYRLACQSCHGPAGTGSPPDVNSLVGPVQGTSAAFLAESLRKRNLPVDEAFMQELASGARNDLNTRLDEGGERMQAFGWMRADEREALVGHLLKLADIPGTAPTGSVTTEPVVRVGELLVKGTCHVCHDATGPRRKRMAIMMGSIVPSLASFATDYSIDEVIAKVRRGESVSSMMMMQMGTSKMPRFPYLTPEEIVAAVIYLSAYPPQAALSP